MKLSEVLDKYYVLALNQSEIVGFTINEDADDNDVNPITITWNDSDTLNSYLQVFDDQEVVIGSDTVTGMFVVEDAENQTVGFIALDGVDLTPRPFVGEEHPRYTEWHDEVVAGNTLLGLADWLEHNPVEEDDHE